MPHFPSETKRHRELEQEFRRGYYLAVANIMRLHNQDVIVIAREVLSNYGAVNLRGIDAYDIEVLKPLADEIKRRSKLNV